MTTTENGDNDSNPSQAVPLRLMAEMARMGEDQGQP